MLKRMRPVAIVRPDAILLVCALATLCLGCGGAKVARVESDPTFTYTAISSDGLAIGHVANRYSSEGEDVSSDELTSLLRVSFLAERHNLEPLDPGELGLNWQRCGHLLDAYERAGRLNGKMITELDSLLTTKVRYLVFARVEKNNVVNHDRTEEQENGEVVRKQLKLGTSRSMAINFHVYDMASHTRAMSALVTGESTNWQTHDLGESGSGGGTLLGSLLGGLFGGGDKSKYEYPDEPTTEEVAELIFKKFAKQVPGAS